MLNKYTLRKFKIFSTYVMFLFSCNITNAHQNISLGCEWKYLFNTIRQIFDKNTCYGGKLKWDLLNTIPMTYKILTRYPVTGKGYNYKHNLQWHLISWKKNKPLLNIAIANYLEEKNEGDIDVKEVKTISTHKIISSWWINIGVMYNLLEDKRDERRDCFCYGLGVNYSKMSICYDDTPDKKGFRRAFYHHVWFNFSIFGKCIFSEHFSLGTTITIAFLILRLRKIGDEIDMQTDGTIIGYDFVPQRRFTLINSQPILTLTIYFEI